MEAKTPKRNGPADEVDDRLLSPCGLRGNAHTQNRSSPNRRPSRSFPKGAGCWSEITSRNPLCDRHHTQTTPIRPVSTSCLLRLQGQPDHEDRQTITPTLLVTLDRLTLNPVSISVGRYSFAANFPLPLLKAIRGVHAGFSRLPIRLPYYKNPAPGGLSFAAGKLAME